MINQMTIDGVKAVITYDSDIDLQRGEFIGLNGGADFYAADVKGLRREEEISLKVFMDACREDMVDLFKAFSGKFNVRVPVQLHAELVGREFIERIREVYGIFTAIQISNTNHEPGTPWGETWGAAGVPKNTDIDDNLIKRYFDRLRGVQDVQ
ncbi:MAG: type II toxin-antitoxin system HicB family antitoxin [Methylococcales bacterium]